MKRTVAGLILGLALTAGPAAAQSTGAVVEVAGEDVQFASLLLNTGGAGQVLTVPADQIRLSAFTLRISNASAPGQPPTVGLDVYAVASETSGGVVLGPRLFRSPGVVLADGGGTQAITFRPNTPVTAGSRIALAARLVQPGGGFGDAGLAGPFGDPLPGAYRYTCDDTTCETNGATDVNFRAEFATTPAGVPVPTLSEWAMILFGGLLAAGAAFVIGRRRAA